MEIGEVLEHPSIVDARGSFCNGNGEVLQQIGEALEHPSIVDARGSFCNGNGVQRTDKFEEIENPGVDFLNDFELCLEYIKDGLTISRMVNDSVIKGIVSAVEQEAAEKIVLKEAELAELKKASKFYQISSDDDNMCSDSVMWLKRKGSHCFECSDVLCHTPYESLENLKISAHKQFKKLKKDIDEIKGSSSMKRKSSSSELLGLSGILEENTHDKWFEVYGTIESLRNNLDSICKHTEGIFCIYESSFCQRQQESKFRSEIEGMVMKNCMVAVLELLERRGWGNSAQHSKDIENYQENIKEISSLRKELDLISKSLSAQENGHVLSHGSLELQKAAGNHISPATLLWEGNGKHDDHIITKPENFDLAQLKHLSRDALAHHCKEELLQLKRHHEQRELQMTEKYFSLRREYLKERESSLPVRKDKEFDMLRKKIPDVIQKLDTILVESEKFPAFNCNTKSHDDLSARVDFLLSENCRLRELLAEKEKEIKCLSVHVSEASKKQAEQSMTESKLLRIIQNLKWAKDDLNVEHLFNEDLCKFLLKEALGLIYQKLIVDDDGQGNNEVASGEAIMECDPTGLLQISDSDMEDAIVQGLCEVIFRETYRDTEKKFSELRLKYDNEVKLQWSLEMESLEKEKASALIVAEKDRLEQSNLLLKLVVDEKEKSVREAASALAEEEDKFKVVSEELSKLKAHASLLSKSVEESKVIKVNLEEALQKISVYEREHCELRGKLDLVTKQLHEVAQQNDMLVAVSQEKDNALNVYETREKKHRNQLDAIIVLVQRLSATISDFECLAAESIRRNCLRVEILVSQLGSFIPSANQLKKMAMTYKQRLERRSSDLQKAEAEVDLLGDEVDALLSLLEKIYIALDHYSPVLQHYPGVIEILKLVRRELSGQALKSV